MTAKVKQWPAVPRTILSGYAVRSIPKENIKKADLVDKILAELDKVYLKDATSRWFEMRNKNVKKEKKMPVNFKLSGKYREVRKQAFYFYNGILDKNTGSGCFGSEAVAH